jgi:hypothetical protein
MEDITMGRSVSGLKISGANALRKVVKALGPKFAPKYSAHRTISDKVVTALTLRASSAAVCEVNYLKDWDSAEKAATNTLPQPIFISPDGQLYPTYSTAGLMYIPAGKTKSTIISVMSEIRNIFPQSALYMNPLDLLHVSAFIFNDLRTKPIPQEELMHSYECVAQIEALLRGKPSLKFSIVGVNLTDKGVIYLKAYPHDDILQNARNEAENQNPWVRHKDVFNITIGRLYKQLTPEEYQRALFNIRRYYLNYYIGDVTFDTVKFMYLKKDALIGLGSSKDILKEVKLG